MPDLPLPPGPDALMDAVRTPLARAFGGEHHLRLGGGTALAARWHHRHSTDVDLFVEPDPYRHFHWNTGGRFILDLTAAAPVDRLVIDADGAYISFRGRAGHVSVAPVRGLPLDPRSSDTVPGTKLPFETTAEILAKKIRFRMARDKELLPRDLYDIAFARQRDPGRPSNRARCAFALTSWSGSTECSRTIASGRTITTLPPFSPLPIPP